MSTASKYQGGFKKESTYGTAVTVDTFFPVVSDTITPQYATLDSNSLRPGFARHQGSYVKYILGAQGQLTFEVSSRQYAKWLFQMMGTVDTTTSLADASYKVHTYTMSADIGIHSFTWQGARPTFPSDDANPFTFSGGKVSKWKLSNAAEGLLALVLDCDFQDWTDGTALASASYPSGDTLFSFQGASVLFDNTSVDVYDIEVEVDNQLKLDRRYLNGSGLKSEPVENGNFRMGTWAAKMDFDDMTQVDRISAASASAGGVAAIEATWGIPGSDIAELKVTIPAARFDEGFPEVGGPESLTTPLKGAVMFDGTNSPITIVATTKEQVGS